MLHVQAVNLEASALTAQSGGQDHQLPLLSAIQCRRLLSHDGVLFAELPSFSTQVIFLSSPLVEKGFVTRSHFCLPVNLFSFPVHTD